jgi:hypothetical protein
VVTRVGAVLLVLAGFGLVGFGWLLSRSAVVDAAASSPFVVPAEVSVHLPGGQVVVYARDDAGTGVPSASDLRVTGPDGPLSATALTGRVLRHEAREFSSIAAFSAPGDGSYRVAVSGPAGSRVQVVPDLSARSLAGTGLIVLGLVVATTVLLLGGVLLLVGLVRGRSARG